MTVQENITRKSNALEKLKAHCLCLSIDGDIVYLPDGYAVDGLRINETANGYEAAERKLEEIWQGSIFWK